MTSSTQTPQKIGFIGLGIMGAPMAGHLIAAGHTVFVHTRSKVASAIAESRATQCTTARGVAERADVIFTMLPDTSDVERVLFGDQGVAAGLSAGKTVVDMSSISPIATKAFAQRINALGCAYLDAPVSGGEVGAKNATLSIMVGAEEADFERVLPLFQLMGKNITRVGGHGDGQTAKVANQIIVALNIEAVAEGEVSTSELKMLMFKYPGFLEVKEGATTTFTPLVQTSEESMEIGAETVRFSPDPPKLLAEFFPSGKKLTLAARLGGKCKSAFPNGRPASTVDTSTGPEHLAESKGDIAVVVVADVDFLEDRSWVQIQNFLGQRIPYKMADNGDFVVNTLDFMRGSTDLVSLRARGVSSYPFQRVEDLKRIAEQNFRAEEQRLSDERQKTERELNDLLSKSGDNAEQVLMSAEVQGKIEDLRKALVDTNKRLREVRFNLNKDVESLGTRLKVLNIVLVPLVVIAIALLVAFYRQNRRKTA